MFWTTVLVLVALTFSQVPAGLVKPGFFVEDGISRASTASERIVSGWEASPGQIPYIVALRLVNAAGDVRDCGGSVVHRSWVLTVATCTFSRTSAVVRAGITDLTTSTPEYISETTEWWIHPAYTNVGLSPNDISIMKLQQLLTYNKLVQPVRVQPSAEAFADYNNEMVIASGWGRRTTTGGDSDVLNWVYLRAISNQACRTTPVDENHICASGYNVTSQSTCFGDNGGPLVHPGRDGELVLVGIAAFWRTSGCNDLPAGFIRPGPFHGWLTEVTGLDFDNLNEEIEVTETPELPTETPTTEATEPSTTEPPKPPTTEPPKPPTTEAAEPSTTVLPKPPTTEAPGVSSEEYDDPEASKLLKKLQVNKVQVMVNNNVNNFK